MNSAREITKMYSPSHGRWKYLWDSSKVTVCSPKYRWSNSFMWLDDCIQKARTNINFLEWNVTFHYVPWLVYFPESTFHICGLLALLTSLKRRKRLWWWCDKVIYHQSYIGHSYLVHLWFCIHMNETKRSPSDTKPTTILCGDSLAYRLGTTLLFSHSN